MNRIRIKRIYEPYSNDDGYRILVDRLWPRGLSKEIANIDEWAKNIAPSTELRKEFHHDPSLMDIFIDKYLEELKQNAFSIEFVNLVKRRLEDGNVILLFAAKNEQMNHAVILKEWLEKHFS